MANATLVPETPIPQPTTTTPATTTPLDTLATTAVARGLADITFGGIPLWVIIAAFAGVIAVFAVLGLVRRLRGGGDTVAGGIKLKGVGDAYAVIRDVNTGEVYITPMTRIRRNLYTYVYKKRPYIFIAVVNNPGVFPGGKPVFFGLASGNISAEIDPLTHILSGLARSTDEKLAEILDSETYKSLDEVVARIAAEITAFKGEIPGLPGIAIEIPRVKLVETWIKDWLNRSAALLDALTEIWDTVDTMTKTLHRPSPSEWGKLIVYLAIAGVIVAVSIVLVTLLG